MVTQVRAWLAIALEPSVRTRAVKVAVVVGTVLAIINHGDAVMRGPLPSIVCLKIALTYLVPYCVSTYASVQAIRHLRTDDMQTAVSEYASPQEC